MGTNGPVGLVCNADHPVFASVAARVARRDREVVFFEPGVPIPHNAIDELALLVNKKVRLASFRALHYADRTGVPTWNGFVPTTALSCRLVALYALDAVGCRTPPVTFEKPTGEYVAKTRYGWEGEPSVGGDGDFYQELLRSEPVDYKYYAVDTGDGIETRVLVVRSKLFGEKELLDTTDPDPTLESRVADLVGRFDARALGVDFVRSDGDYYAVDVNVAPSFRDADLEDALVASIESSLRE
ncbi:MAG: hypothetical protein ABEI96_03275 [Haloarculaceae archaeon]